MKSTTPWLISPILVDPTGRLRRVLQRIELGWTVGLWPLWRMGQDYGFPLRPALGLSHLRSLNSLFPIGFLFLRHFFFQNLKNLSTGATSGGSETSAEHIAVTWLGSVSSWVDVDISGGLWTLAIPTSGEMLSRMWHHRCIHDNNKYGFLVLTRVG